MKHPQERKPLPAEAAALFEVVKRGTMNDVKVLLGKGCDPNVRDPLTGNTPLRLAAGLNRLSIAKALLEAGADPNIGNALDTRPLHVAVAALQNREGEEHPPNLRLAQLLLTFGADPDARDYDGRKAIDFAADPERFAVLLAKRLSKRLPLAAAKPGGKNRL
jgi:ankyrin repeat protein